MVTMDQARSITANYQLQYQLTLATATTPATSPSAVATSNLTGLASGGWYDSGTTATITAAQDVNGSGSRYDFRSWSAASSATGTQAQVTMSSAQTLTANYQLQYQL